MLLIIITNTLKILTVVLPLLIAVAYIILAERKIIGSIQRRRGPNVVGIFGLLQPLADGLKLLTKETIFPNSANILIYAMAPIITFLLSLIAWSVIPIDEGKVLADINVGMLYLLAVSSLGVYGIIIAGWSSNSKYAFLGGIRSAAQMVSYEVSIGLILITVLVCTGSINLSQIVLAQEKVWYIIPLFPLFLIFFISILAETNRAPFDLPEAEAELVAGYNVEYSAIGFALFFLGEYANIILMSSITTVLFLGGWLPLMNWPPFYWFPGTIWFGIKVTLVLFGFVWVRSVFPRYRYDQLIRLGWKVFLPISLGWVLIVTGILLTFDWLPH
nr:NADH dehydrogenase subunit 1 [Cavernulicola chilensis]